MTARLRAADASRVAKNRWDEASRVTDAYRIQLSRRKHAGANGERIREALAQLVAAIDQEADAYDAWAAVRRG